MQVRTLYVVHYVGVNSEIMASGTAPYSALPAAATVTLTPAQLPESHELVKLKTAMYLSGEQKNFIFLENGATKDNAKSLFNCVLQY